MILLTLVTLLKFGGGLLVTAAATSSTENKEYCPLEVFSAKCAADEVIIITTAVYGRMRAGKCISGEGYTGCSTDVTSFLETLCAGKHKCDVPVMSIADPFQPCKKDFTSYLEAGYKCIKVPYHSSDTCRQRRYADVTPVSGGFLSSVVSVERAIGLSSSCPWRLQAKVGQKFEFRLTAFDSAALLAGGRSSPQGQQGQGQVAEGPSAMDLAAVRRAWRIVFEEGGRTDERQPQEGSTKDTKVYESRGHVVNVYFLLNTKADLAPAFLLAYKVTGCEDLVVANAAVVRRSGNEVTIQCNYSQETRHVLCKDSEWIGDTGNCSVAGKTWRQPDNGHAEVSLSHGIVLAVVMGLIFGVLLGICSLAMLIFCRRRNRHEHYLMRRPDTIPGEAQHHHSCLLHPDFQKQEMLLSSGTLNSSKSLPYPLQRSAVFDSPTLESSIGKQTTLTRAKQGPGQGQSVYECTRVTCPHVPDIQQVQGQGQALDFVDSRSGVGGFYAEDYVKPGANPTNSLSYRYTDPDMSNTHNSFVPQRLRMIY